MRLLPDRELAKRSPQSLVEEALPLELQVQRLSPVGVQDERARRGTIRNRNEYARRADFLRRASRVGPFRRAFHIF